jgi:hypothetical protein
MQTLNYHGKAGEGRTQKYVNYCCKKILKLALGPSLNTARYGASCGVLNWMNPQSNQMEKIVVAAGGGGYNGYILSTTELLYVDRIGDYNWIMGPSLPSTNAFATMVEFQNSVFLIGGDSREYISKDLYQLSSPGANVIKLFFCCKEATLLIIFF